MTTTTGIKLGYQGGEHVFAGIPDFLGSGATEAQIEAATRIYREALYQEYRAQVHPEAYYSPATSELIVPMEGSLAETRAKIGKIDVAEINKAAWEKAEPSILALVGPA